MRSLFLCLAILTTPAFAQEAKVQNTVPSSMAIRIPPAVELGRISKNGVIAVTGTEDELKRGAAGEFGREVTPFAQLLLEIYRLRLELSKRRGER